MHKYYEYPGTVNSILIKKCYARCDVHLQMSSRLIRVCASNLLSKRITAIMKSMTCLVSCTANERLRYVAALNRIIFCHFGPCHTSTVPDKCTRASAKTRDSQPGSATSTGCPCLDSRLINAIDVFFIAGCM